jgi:pimeloyl-ACP methyl ester carboxylesterase
MSDGAPALDRAIGAVRYRVLGEADRPWLVVCHGMALSHRDLLATAEALSDRWQVLLWDMPGHGDSRPAPADWSVPAMTAALERVMDAAAAGEAVLLGFSFGGVVAQYFARSHPERVRALIAHGCFAPFHQKPPLPRPFVGPLVSLLYCGRSWERLKCDFLAACAITEAGRAAIANAPDAVGKAGFLALTKALLLANAPDPAFRLSAPLLAIRGAADRYGPTLDAGFAALAAGASSAETVVVPDAGHCAHLDAPAPFLAAVRRFLDSHPA